jgi:hypothetical protein
MPDKIIVRRGTASGEALFQGQDKLIQPGDGELTEYDAHRTQSSKFGALALFMTLSLTPDMIRVPFPTVLGNSYNWKEGEHLIDAMERKHGLRCACMRAPGTALRCPAFPCMRMAS